MGGKLPLILVLTTLINTFVLIVLIGSLIELPPFPPLIVVALSSQLGHYRSASNSSCNNVASRSINAWCREWIHSVLVAQPATVSVCHTASTPSRSRLFGPCFKLFAEPKILTPIKPLSSHGQGDARPRSDLTILSCQKRLM